MTRTANPWSEQEDMARKIDQRKRIIRGMVSLRRLPEKQYEAYLYCRILMFTEREASDILGIPQRTVNWLVNQAHAALIAQKK